METVIDNFNERTLEVEKYYKVLSLLDDENVSIVKQLANRKKIVELDSDALKVLKSTCFLLLYNLIESSVRESFSYLYDQINNETEGIDNYKESFRKLWINQQFKRIDPISSNQNTYRSIVTEIAEKILLSKNLQLDSGFLPISGNLDAQKIRDLFSKHEIHLRVHHRAFGGGELRTIKDHRNELAHGNISFSECGRQYTVEQLTNIKRRTVIYLRSSLRNIKKYTEQRGYAV